MFVGERAFGFWGGMIGIADDQRQEFHEAVGKRSADVFPLRFAVDRALADFVGVVLADWR